MFTKSSGLNLIAFLYKGILIYLNIIAATYVNNPSPEPNKTPNSLYA
jgi:hypothetical protein